MELSSRAGRLAAALTAACTVVLGSGVALASSVATSVVDSVSPTGLVELSPGGTGTFTIKLTVTGNQDGTATFKVNRHWALDNGTFTGSDPVTETVASQSGGTTTTFQDNGTVTVGTTVVPGDYILAVPVFDITNSNQTGGKLAAGSTGTYTVRVTAPVDPCASVAAPATPTIESSPSAPDGSGTWYVTTPTVNAFTTTAGATIEYATQTVGGLKSGFSTTPPTLTDGKTIVYARATSATCDKTSESSHEYWVDTVAPAASPTDVVDSTWRKTPLSQTFTATDATSGLATDASLTATATADSVDAATPTIATVTFTDVAGNKTTRLVSALIDTVPPVASPADVVDTVWRHTPLSRVFTATDALSGLATPGTQTATAAADSVDASHPTVDTVTFTDLAGNTTTRRVSALIDTVAPTVTPGSVIDSTWRNGPLSQEFTASDSQSGVVGDTTVTLTADGDSTDPSTPTVASHTFVDAAGNETTRSVSAFIDTVKPVIVDQGPSSDPDGANGWYVSPVTNTFTASDALSGLANPDQATIVRTTTQEGPSVTVESGSVADVAGNVADSLVSAPFKVDLSNPVNVQFVGGPADSGVYTSDTVPAEPTCTAEDAVSGLAGCEVTGYDTSVGTHTLTATATDNAGRTTTAQLTYTVRFTVKGFYAPVDMNGVLNTVKGGSTVPLKFEIFDAGTEQTSTALVAGLAYKESSCTVLEDPVETLSSTGGTSLRYDTTAGQFIYNWQTPKTSGKCYTTTVTLTDGSKIQALFKTK